LHDPLLVIENTSSKKSSEIFETSSPKRSLEILDNPSTRKRFLKALGNPRSKIIKIEDLETTRKQDLSEVFENGKKKFRCNFCEMVITTKQGVQQHIESRHYGVRYECSECQKTLTFRHDFRRHVERYHPDVPNVGYEMITIDPKKMFQIRFLKGILAWGDRHDTYVFL
jgi:hypothetical protein